VRQEATKCIVELYKQLGEKIRPSLKDLRQAQLDQIESALVEANLKSNFNSKS
jgi:hypothetical protein